MNRTDAPKKQPVPFAINGPREDLLSTTPAGSNQASYDVGFPAITMLLKSAGGLPPKGQDMNQILYELCSIGRWFSAGALNSFDAAFSTSIGGYPKGAVLISDNSSKIFVSTTDGNTNNPNSVTTGWLDLLSYLSSGLASLAGLTGAADTLPYFTGANTYSLTSLTSVGRNLISQTSIANALFYLQGAPINSPSFTGTPFAPTAAAGTNNTQIATTQFAQSLITALIGGAPSNLNTLNKLASAVGNDPIFSANVNAALNTKAPLASPALTGSPTAPTPTAGDNSTLLATTAFVSAAITAFMSKRSFALNDFIRIPDVPGGLIVQWGTTSGSDATGLSQATLPTPFPNGGLCAVCAYYSGGRYAITTQVASITQTTIQLFASVSSTGAAAPGAAIRYFVLGY
ncbi:gp53-like domain-containing protein [Phytobacter diazotrophicus]|uniref:gp53-like domain-containing protein n=1 Tax=Phytobacter diazotrophicus TaxID=395631 RepID=UPI003B589A58